MDVSKLVDLSTLNVTASYNLSHMPSDLGKLTNLHTLGRFVVGRPSSDGLDCFDGSKELQSLNNLKGQLDIRIGVLKAATYVKKDHGGGAYLRRKKCLTRILIEFTRVIEYGSMEQEQALVEEMQPHHDLVFLKIEGYHGETIPRWPRREDNSALFYLPKLLTLVISRCEELLCLPWQVGKLPLLKQLKLLELSNMEYVVNANPEASGSGEGPTFFPRLKELEVIQLPKLEGWWPKSGSEVQDEHIIWESSRYFAQLNKLKITLCPMMTSIPISSHVADLLVQNSGRNLIWRNLYSSQVPQSSQHLLTNLNLRTLAISQLDWLQSMPAECFQRLGGLLIQHDKEVESLEDVRKLFQTDIFSSMLFVQIVKCPKLRNDGGWLRQISALHSLVIFDCPNIVDGIPWRHLPKSLQRLCLEFDNELVQLEELPYEMQYCTSLQYLTISNWPQLHSLPNWLPELTVLKNFCCVTVH
ncbi:disease resistance protein RGA2-like [Silene latifolia]|uniref:disease resistance protein RGA2-like n=1 Tax=Silene latifolia TaxID=37657 RepID=UPI003D7871AD